MPRLTPVSTLARSVRAFGNGASNISITVSCWTKLMKGRSMPFGARRLTYRKAVRASPIPTSEANAEKIATVTTSEQREKLQAEIKLAEEWLFEGEADNAKTADFKAKYDALLDMKVCQLTVPCHDHMAARLHTRA